MGKSQIKSQINFTESQISENVQFTIESRKNHNRFAYANNCQF